MLCISLLVYCTRIFDNEAVTAESSAVATCAFGTEYMQLYGRRLSGEGFNQPLHGRSPGFDQILPDGSNFDTSLESLQAVKNISNALDVHIQRSVVCLTFRPSEVHVQKCAVLYLIRQSLRFDSNSQPRPNRSRIDVEGQLWNSQQPSMQRIHYRKGRHSRVHAPAR